MNINLYIKAHVFNSSKAAVELAQKDTKYQHFAETMILKKLDKIMNSNNIYRVDKASKYNNLLTDLSKNTTFPEKYYNYEGFDSGKSKTALEQINDFINTPEHIHTMKAGILKSGDEVIADKKPNLQRVRSIVTNLTSLSKLRDNGVAVQAQQFLDKSIDGTDFRSFGNKENYSDETLRKVKNCVGEIQSWINGMQQA